MFMKSSPEYEKLVKEIERQAKAGMPAKDIAKQLGNNDLVSQLDENLREQLQSEVDTKCSKYDEATKKQVNQIQLQIKYFDEQVEPLKTNKSNKITAIQYMAELKLAGKIAVEDVVIVKQEDKDGALQYLVVDRDAKPVATIGEDFSVQIDENYLQQYEGYIGKPGEQTEQQKEIFDYDKVKPKEGDAPDRESKKYYKCEQIQEQEEEKKKNIDDKKKKFSHTRQDVGADITAIVEIENKEELAAILDTDIPSVTNAYIVKFSDGATRICLEQGETIKEIASDIHTQQIEAALRKTMNLEDIDGTKLRSNEFRAAEKPDSDKQLVIINPEHSGRDQVVESDGATGRVRSGEFVKNSDGKMVQVKGSVLYPQNIQMETDLKNYEKQETELDEAIDASDKLEKLLEAARLQAEIESIRKSDINVKDKYNMLNEKRRDLEDVLDELGMDYEDAEKELEEAGEDVPDVEEPDTDDDGDRGGRLTPEEEALRRNHM